MIHSLIEASELEEQGIRYRDGDKSFRFYLRANDLYETACSKPEADADAFYNWSRVLFTLAEFQKPVPSLKEREEFLVKALETCRKSLKFDPDSIDASFNLAQIYHSLGEVLLENAQPNGWKMLEKAENALMKLHDYWMTQSISEEDMEEDIQFKKDSLRDVMEVYFHLQRTRFNHLNDISLVAETLKGIRAKYQTFINALNVPEIHHAFAQVLLTIVEVSPRTLVQDLLILCQEALSLLQKYPVGTTEAICDRGDVEITMAELYSVSGDASSTYQMWQTSIQTFEQAATMELGNEEIKNRLAGLYLLGTKWAPEKQFWAAKACHFYRQLLGNFETKKQYTRAEAELILRYTLGLSWTDTDRQQISVLLERLSLIVKQVGTTIEELMAGLEEGLVFCS